MNSDPFLAAVRRVGDSAAVDTKNRALRTAAKRGMAILVFSMITSPVLACPMCKDSTVDTGKAGVTETAGLDFNKSIYIMLGGFATVVGFTGRMMYMAAQSRP
jgi:hypothetical protein